jgi:hypothetical protein
MPDHEETPPTVIRDDHHSDSLNCKREMQVPSPSAPLKCDVQKGSTNYACHMANPGHKVLLSGDTQFTRNQ